MASGQFAGVYRQLGRLFKSGSVAGLSEGQLLDRFVARRDDTAFEAIIARHGPMVLGVCRGILRDPNDVEDAFQATFLILVKKADVLARRDLLGNWLYGVALRVARRARADANKRRSRESSGPEPVDRSGIDLNWLDIRPMIHDEVSRLPESYRAAVILCFLEGQTHEAAAQQLGWPVGTVKGRLARAKELLRDRLGRRGLALPSTALVAMLAREGQTAVTPMLVSTTISAAVAVATAPFASVASLSLHAISPHAIVLTQGVLQTMSTVKLKLAATVLVAGLITAPGVSAYQAVTPAPAPKAALPGSIAANQSASSKYRSRIEARIEIAREALEAIDIASKIGFDPDMNQISPRWSKELQTAMSELEEIRIREEGPRYYVNKAEARLRTARENLTKREGMFKAGQVKRLTVLDAQLEQINAEEALDQAKSQLGIGGGTAQPAAAAQVKKENQAEEVITQNPKVNAATSGDTGTAKPSPTKERKSHPVDTDRNHKIEAALEKVVPIPFAIDTRFEDALRYFKENAKDDKGRKVPIYLDPKAEANSDKMGLLNRTVILDIDDLPLRTTLRLMLNQVGLEYRIRDGLLFISDAENLGDEADGTPKRQNNGKRETSVGGGGFQ